MPVTLIESPTISVALCGVLPEGGEEDAGVAANAEADRQGRGGERERGGGGERRRQRGEAACAGICV